MNNYFTKGKDQVKGDMDKGKENNLGYEPEYFDLYEQEREWKV